MERLLNYMDRLITHWQPLTRRYPSAFPLQTVGSVPEKADWVRRIFQTVNFSFILKGGGRYHCEGKSWEVKAPAVITQWPGPLLRYGPSEPHTTWHEVFLIYGGETLDALSGANLIRPDKPVWRIHQASTALALMEELLQLCRHPSADGAPDRADRVAETLIVESLLGEPQVEPDPGTRAVNDVRRQIRQQPQLQPDWLSESESHGISHATFRRHWQRIIGLSPNRYLTAVRLREARRLLVETGLSIGEIAERVGYSDPLYFSRRFRSDVGVTARAYRRTHQRRDTNVPPS